MDSALRLGLFYAAVFIGAVHFARMNPSSVNGVS